MAMTSEEFLRLAEQGALANANLTGLTEQQARANALRDSMETINPTTGQGSYLGLIADFIGQKEGRRRQRMLTPRIDEARRNVGLAKAAKQRYDVEQAAEKQAYDRAFKEDERTYDREMAEQKRADMLARREMGEYVDPQGNRQIVRTDAFGRAYDDAGNPIENFSQWREYERPRATRGGSGLSLSGSSLRTGLEKLGKRLEMARPLIDQVNNIDAKLAPYATGGTREGQDIPGIGPIEGSRGVVGDTYRFLFSSQEGKDIFSGISAFVTDVLRQKAGTAQTFNETQNVLKSIGVENLNNEQTLINNWPRIRAAAQQDLARIKSTTHKDVLREYYASFPEGVPTEFETQFSTQTFPTGDTRPNIQKVTGTRETPVQAGPSVGTEMDGYRFLGGDPADPNSWEQIR